MSFYALCLAESHGGCSFQHLLLRGSSTTRCSYPWHPAPQKPRREKLPSSGARGISPAGRAPLQPPGSALRTARKDVTPPAPRPPPHRRAKPEQPNPVPPAPPQPRPALTSRRRSRTARAEGGRTRQRGWGPGGPRGQRRSIAAAIGASGSAERGGRRRSQRETKPAPPAGTAPGEAAPRRGGASPFPRPASVPPGGTGLVPREGAPCMDGLESPSEK